MPLLKECKYFRLFENAGYFLFVHLVGFHDGEEAVEEGSFGEEHLGLGEHAFVDEDAELAVFGDGERIALTAVGHRAVFAEAEIGEAFRSLGASVESAGRTREAEEDGKEDRCFHRRNVYVINR